MRKFTWLLLLLLAGNAFSQAPKADFRYGAMLSNLSSVQRTTTIVLSPTNVPLAIDKVSTVDWLQLVPSFTWQGKKGDFGQVSIPLWQMQRQQTVRTDSNNIYSASVDRKLNLGIQYTYSIRFLKQKATKWLPMLGFGLMPYMQHTHTEPLVDTQFASSDTKVGLRGSLNPHVMWMPTSHLFVDMGLSLSLFDFNVSSYIDEIPTIPIQGTYIVNWDMLHGSNGVHIGVGFKI